MPSARTWSKTAMERVEIILSISRNSHNPSSSPKSGVFSPARLRASFPGVWSRLHTVLCKPFHQLFFCMKAQVWSSPSRLPITLVPIASSLSSLHHPSGSQRQPHPCSGQLFTLKPEVPGARTISFELIRNPAQFPLILTCTQGASLRLLNPMVFFKSFFHPKL